MSTPRNHADKVLLAFSDHPDQHRRFSDAYVGPVIWTFSSTSAAFKIELAHGLRPRILPASAMDVAAVNGIIAQCAVNSSEYTGLVPFLAAHTPPAGVPMLVIPYYRNGCLLAYVKKHPEQRIRLLQEVAGIIRSLHVDGIVHGSICPDNIFINDDGQALIMDSTFDDGLCRMTGEMNQSPQSWEYISERMCPREDSDTSIKPIKDDDVHAFLCTNLQALTGSPPLKLNRPEVSAYAGVARILTDGYGQLTQPPAIPDELWALMKACWAPSTAPSTGMCPSILEVASCLQGLLNTFT
ncbi:hypothetical protein PLICRDRAFT_173814 [Plicaturopsis crispa FD-325 SS-3]|nr:hypothetical protein PLICRDRAFT_173814 [Plicaturopsis crispa FD-325 SS-3]